MRSLKVLCLVAQLVALCTALQPHEHPTSTARPNVLFLMVDEMDGRVMDPTSYVWSAVHMPNLRKLAARGVNFVRCYSPSPQCVPSRTAMFTSRRTDQIRTWNNGQGLAASASGQLDESCVQLWSKEQCQEWSTQQSFNTTLLKFVADHGMNTHVFGKVDVGANILAEHPKATANGFHSGPSLPILTRAADVRRATKPNPLNITDDHKGLGPFPHDWQVVDDCVQWLNKHGSNPTEPWFVYCSIVVPHPPFYTNETWLKYVNDSALDIPTWLPEEKFHPYDSYMSQSKAMWGNFSKANILKVRRTYFAMCAQADYLLGRVLRALAATGQEDNTLVMFVSDHGEMNMEHRQVWKNSMYEGSSRVPMTLAGPGIPSGRVDKTLVSLLDVLPTVADAIGVAPPEGVQGYSLFPLVHEQAQPHRPDYIVSQYHSNMGNTGSFMLRQGQWKLIEFGHNFPTYGSYAPQLFNVDQDPRELQDVSSENPQLVKSMSALLASVLNTTLVDGTAKQQDRVLYQKFFVGQYSPDKLQTKFSRAYHGFASGDRTKVQQWMAFPAPPTAF